VHRWKLYVCSRLLTVYEVSFNPLILSYTNSTRVWGGYIYSNEQDNKLTKPQQKEKQNHKPKAKKTKNSSYDLLTVYVVLGDLNLLICVVYNSD
jgi:cytoskeletal protein RodZ